MTDTTFFRISEQDVPKLSTYLCRELYDRFVMGGWEPKDAHTQTEEIIKAHATREETTREGMAKKELLEIRAKFHKVGMLEKPETDRFDALLQIVCAASLGTTDRTQDAEQIISQMEKEWRNDPREYASIVVSALASLSYRLKAGRTPERTQEDLTPAVPPWDETRRIEELEWAVGRWQMEVANRPLVNVHRRSLDDTWRQVIRHFGGKPELLIGPDHDTLLAGRTPETGETRPLPTIEEMSGSIDFGGKMKVDENNEIYFESEAEASSTRCPDCGSANPAERGCPYEMCGQDQSHLKCTDCANKFHAPSVSKQEGRKRD